MCQFWKLRRWQSHKQKKSWVPESLHGGESYATRNIHVKTAGWDFPGGTVLKNPPTNAGNTGLSPGLGRSHMEQSN